MKFTYDNKELDILEEGPEEVGIFNYCKTMAGHTLMIGKGYKLNEIEGFGKHLYLIERDWDVFMHDTQCEGSMCWCSSRYKKKVDEMKKNG